VGKLSAQSPSRPVEKLFVEFVGPLLRTRKGNLAILVVVDSFSKFVWFFPVKRIASSVAIECLENTYFPSFGSPTTLVTDNAKVFHSCAFKDL
jgi:hypothetical protein